MQTTERLILKQPEHDDIDHFFEIYSDPETNLFNPLGPVSDRKIAARILNAMIEHWEKYKFGAWKIMEKSQPDVVIGFGGLNYRLYNEELKLNLGFRFGKQAWGKGYATELARKAIAFGFNEFNKKAIYGLVRPKNAASINVLEKCGLTPVAELDDVPGEEKSLIYKIENKTIR
ncbi:GNAT family N-acetyltransferase [Rapidithrix thailandica]|uniref:GNAT family N-acetyltransferase n=1 Tax=Rapidithrix thailandica TaxID=413964 RepID=A0AAW9S8D6_9BACT